MARRKEYEVALQIGGKVQGSLGRAIGATNKQLSFLQRQARTTSRVFKTAMGMAAGYFSVRAIKDFASASTQAARDQIEQETKLEAVLKNVASLQKQGPDAYRRAKAELVGVANQMQQVGIIADDITLAGFQQLATFQLSDKEINILSAGMGDLLAQQKGFNATHQDAVNIANMMGKVLDGQVGALKRVGISFTAAQEKALKTGDRMQRAAILAEVLQQNVGGVNEALRQTDEGKIWAMNAGLGEMQETLGKRILPLQARFAGWFTTKIPGIEKIMVRFMDRVEQGIDFISDKYNSFRTNVLSKIVPPLQRIGGAFLKVAKAIMPNVGALSNMGSKILPVLVGGLETLASVLNKVADFYVKHKTLINALAIGIGSAVIAFKGINKAKQIMFGLKASFTAAKASLALFTSPIGIAAVAIGGLVAAGYLLYKNWDKVKAKALELKNSIVSAFKYMGEKIAAFFKAPVNVVIGLINNVITGLNKLNIKVPKWVPGLGGKEFGFNIAQVPMLAKGTKYFAGGLAIVGERGRELVNIPRGSQVTPNNRTEALLKELSGAGAGQAVQVTYAPQYIIQGSADVDTMKQVSRQAYDDFERRFNGVLERRKRLNFAGV